MGRNARNAWDGEEADIKAAIFEQLGWAVRERFVLCAFCFCGADTRVRFIGLLYAYLVVCGLFSFIGALGPTTSVLSLRLGKEAL